MIMHQNGTLIDNILYHKNVQISDYLFNQLAGNFGIPVHGPKIIVKGR